ncbi:MAG: 1-acyl-sn-glycerol-3-phosphate acyltransferase [Dehalococcoidia bacterium]|nr:MAG: 1-acyl-sn-glycerol-3-phosphate acyltransferase [Dehalococcoidia bacterium]
MLLTRRSIKGRENIPKRGAVIFVANHIELVDSPLLWTSLGRRVYFMAKEEVFYPAIIGYCMRSFGAFPIKKGRQDRKALLTAQELLTEGKALAIYPEGMRSQSRKVKLAFHGAALIASRSGAPIIPIGISGTEQIRGVGWIWRRPYISLEVGKPFSLPPIDGKPTKYELARLTDVIMEHVTEKLPELYRGCYRPRSVTGVES